MTGLILKLGAEAGALLAVSYLLFVCVAKVKWLAPAQRARAGRMLVAASVLSPLLFASVPGPRLRALPLPMPRAFSEGRIHFSGLAPGKAATPMVAPEDRPPATAATWRWDYPGLPGAAELLLLAWIAGALGMAGLLGRDLSRLRALILASGGLRAAGRVRVRVSDTLSVPLSAFHFGYFYVILPASLLQRHRDFRLALRHELQHHRQGDTLFVLLLEALTCVFFWNPVIYLWKRKIVGLQEIACDDALVGQQKVSRREYGSCLVRVAEAALGSREMYAGTTYMAAAAGNPRFQKTFLKERIEMILSQERRKSSMWAALITGTLSLTATVGVAYGVERAARAVAEAMPNPGTVVVDEKIQKIAERILADAVSAEEASEGFAIVADPRNGKILAVANVDTKGKKSGFWALSQQLEPASIAKTLVVAEAIERGRTTPEEKHYCENGRYKFGGRVFHDWREDGFSHLSTTQTVARSSDICTVKIAEKIGLEGVHELLAKFGFGPGGTASAFAGGRPGWLPPREGELGKFLVPYVAYGQGFRSSPLELVQAYGAIANGGELLMPLAADASEGDKKVVRKVLSEENSKKMREILREVVLSGTGKRNASSYLYSTAGKTASSYSPDESWLETSRGTRRSNMAGFIGFAPVEKPRVEVFVAIRDPKVSVDPGSGAHGAEHAAPVFKQITEAVLQHLNVAPDRLGNL